jgi:2-polyprenyl-3-methyl-5-hydroxy-6-metoxy-1,4-benzoquinol methylase
MASLNWAFLSRIRDDRSSIQDQAGCILKLDREEYKFKTRMKGDCHMNAIVKESQTTQEVDRLKDGLKTTWMTGDYDLFSRYLEKGGKRFFQRLGITPGTRLLDVGCGAGQLALIAARAGA